MSKIKAVVPKMEECIEYDWYIPIKIRFGKDEPYPYTERTNYLHIGRDRELLEIGIYEKSKAIKSITLVSWTDIYESNPFQDSVLTVEEWCPIIEYGQKEDERLYMEEAIHKVYIEANSVYLIFSDKKPKYCIENGKVSFSSSLR